MKVELDSLTSHAASLAVVLPVFLVAATASAGERFCSATASAQFSACRAEIRDDSYEAKAICINFADDAVRSTCLADADEERREGSQLCRDQKSARIALCDRIGEGRYDPDFDPAHFDDDFGSPTHPNPYFPLAIGNVWEFESADESTRIEVLDEIKRIEGVACIVVRDRVSLAAGGGEDTDDWFALRKTGEVDYCGEEVKDFETFPGDVPMNPELVAIDGSFKAGRDGAKPGVVFLAAPIAGETYRQEWSAGNAEDAATVLSVGYEYGADPDLDRFVPRALAELLCAASDCVVTEDFTPIEPDVAQRKYYANGIGAFLEVDPETGETNQLVDCNFDARCALLPAP